MFPNDEETLPGEEEAAEDKAVEEAPEEAPEVEKKSRKRRGRKVRVEEPAVEEEPKVIPLETIDRDLQPKEEKPESSDPVIPDADPNSFPEGTFIVDAAWAEKLLQDTNNRHRNVNDSVACLGHGRQKWFVIELASWRLNKGGILYVPESLAGFSLLNSWERLEGNAPDGFVAFRAQ